MCFKNKESFDTVLKKYFSEPYTLGSVQPMRELFQSLKRTNFEVFLAYLKNNEEIKNNFRDYLFILFSNKSFAKALTDANILSENAFFPELKKRISYKFLPPVEDENTISYIISKVLFNPKSDSDYIKNIKPEDGSEFFKLMEIEKISTLPKVKKELLISANILALRSVGNALEAGITKMVPEYKNFDNPFVALQSELDSLIGRFKKDKDLQIDSKDVDYKQIKIYLQQCLDFVDKAFKNASKFGISSKINQSLLKIRQQLKRIQDIIPILVVDTEEDILTNSKNLVSNTLKYNSHRNNVRELIDDSTRLISHLITSHTAETGTHYIATSPKEYLKMFWKASGGGIIVGFLCIFKMMMSYSHGSEFSHAVLYSLNYAFGFIIIYLLGFTLATKQPAMTAATMAKVLSDESSSEKNYKEFANLVAKLSRTQFIAFVGNVLWSFPVALAIIYGMDWFLEKNFAVAKADKLLKDLNPIESKAILHACIAGFFLFISGIISGNISNSSIFNQIPERISQSPFLNQVIGAKNSKKLSDFYTKHWAGIISNFWFGIFLGVIAPLGVFLGLDLDIRHITFSAGNFALALYGKGFDIDTYTFTISLVTIFLIGAFNFIVSFGLSMLLAFRSRKVNFGELTIIYKTILKYFIKNPLRFFIPLKSELDEASKDLIQDNKTHH
ncbi:MAG: recombinase [Flavobacteriaceae bacterium]|nr:recombinase [Flavobacteriaceae bacterium]